MLCMANRVLSDVEEETKFPEETVVRPRARGYT